MEKKLPQLIQETLARFPVQRPLRLMFQDEARFGRISDCCYCWYKKPLRPLVKAILTHQYVYAYGAVSISQGNFDSLVLPHFSAARYRNENIMMVLGGAGGYKNQSMPIPGNICLLSVPP